VIDHLDEPLGGRGIPPTGPILDGMLREAAFVIATDSAGNPAVDSIDGWTSTRRRHRDCGRARRHQLLEVLHSREVLAAQELHTTRFRDAAPCRRFFGLRARLFVTQDRVTHAANSLSLVVKLLLVAPGGVAVATGVHPVSPSRATPQLTGAGVAWSTG